MFERTLGRSGIRVSALGLGCWAIGGPAWRGDKPIGWGEVNDAESTKAIRRALELGVNFFDTADVYGAGHSEKILAEALGPDHDKVIIATKFGFLFNEETRQATGECAEPKYIREACEASLRRLKRDYIDLYQFHLGPYDPGEAAAVRDTLENVVESGKIRWYGWSTNNAAGARVFGEGPHCAAIQMKLNIFEHHDETLGVCEELNLASVNRGPLVRGLLTGKFTADSKLPDDDVRRNWDFSAGVYAEQIRKLEAMREVLTADGRSLAQAALGWIWAKSKATIPIPGFKTAEQVAENAAAMDVGPLTDEQMKQIDKILAG